MSNVGKLDNEHQLQEIYPKVLFHVHIMYKFLHAKERINERRNKEKERITEKKQRKQRTEGEKEEKWEAVKGGSED